MRFKWMLEVVLLGVVLITPFASLVLCLFGMSDLTTTATLYLVSLLLLMLTLLVFERKD